MSLQTIRDPSIVFSDFAKIQASYIIFTDGIKIYAKNGNTGNIEFIDTDISNLLQNVINTLYSNYGGGKIFIKRGTYYPSKEISIPDGIKLIVEGEGDLTLFRWTSFLSPGSCLFSHIPSNPSWTSVIVLKNFKVDRTGSGNNVGGMNISYAKFVMYDGIEWIDDWRDTDGDCAIYGANNLIAIAQNNRIFNKSYGIFLGGYLVVLRNNYVNNTAKVGIVSQSVYRSVPVPPNEPPYAISIVENNLCVDCGRTDEALGVDANSNAPTQSGLAVIRSNAVITKNYTTKGAITGIRVTNIIVENNLIAGNFGDGGIFSFYAPNGETVVVKGNRVNATTSGKIVNAWYTFDTFIFEDNIIDITITSSFRAIDTGNYNRAFVRNNKLNISYNNISQSIDAVMWLSSMYVENNEITVSFPSGYASGTLITGNMPVYIRGNYIDVNVYWLLNAGMMSSGKNEVIITDNIVKNISYLSVLGMYYSMNARSIIRNNVFENIYPQIGFNVASGVSANLYIDADPEIIINPATGVAIYRFRRNSGTATFNGDGTTTQFKIAHGLASTPSKVLVTPASSNATGSFYVTADATYIYVNYTTAPPSGTNNVVLNWYAEV